VINVIFLVAYRPINPTIYCKFTFHTICYLVYSHKTAVLIFANSSIVDEKRKNIPDSSKLFAVLNDDILKKVKRTGLPYFVFDEQLQVGNNFGTRFTSAIQSVFAKGFESIITVGNDTPELTTRTILTSYEQVRDGKTVIGPSMDGGVYLLGFHQNRFDEGVFLELPWQTQQLFRKIKFALLQDERLYQLPRLTDIDAVSDIGYIINHSSALSSVLVVLLLDVLIQEKTNQDHYSSYIPLAFHNKPFNKGSPIQA